MIPLSFVLPIIELNSLIPMNYYLSDQIESAKNDPDIRMQLHRLEQIEDLFQKCRPHVVVYERYLQRYLSPLQQRKVILLDMLDSLATIGHTASRNESI